MEESATGLRERRRLESAERLIDLAREWTARDGFTGFTVDELCEAAGVSRRTFFNYFASKEDAVLGILAPRGGDDLVQTFLAGGSGAAGGSTSAAHDAGSAGSGESSGAGPAVSSAAGAAASSAADTASAGLSSTLVDDFVELHLARWEIMAPSASDFRALKAAIDREPRLHTRIIEQIHANEQRDIALVEKRERLTPGDIRASTLVHLVGAFTRAAAEDYFADQGNTPPSIGLFARVFTQRLAAARELLL
ncbi:TetR/AcrR family transcriptional regulator [Microbacterium sp. MPKO10]|uniref:TetR/AcrR family transcriptional regulator n=1 Tax=Microbacterium sp. MPKO10 TaxID=2989818 RepID=UPI0022357677|nr:helix-turn-helix domain-containing protein [Microbacterium sp. MPKO10]MCW4457511.1 TetR/AcrR family transcriptional regulator [Microbacterium sp. MPKO10]